MSRKSVNGAYSNWQHNKLLLQPKDPPQKQHLVEVRGPKSSGGSKKQFVVRYSGKHRNVR